MKKMRRDIEKNGRNEKVELGKEWKEDEERRDLKINEIYVNEEGKVIDKVGGIEDIEKRKLSLIGDEEKRIREDYMRIMSFLRLFEW